jgi:hypothetical protein
VNVAAEFSDRTTKKKLHNWPQTLIKSDVRYGSLADKMTKPFNVRFAPNSGQV